MESQRPILIVDNTPKGRTPEAENAIATDKEKNVFKWAVIDNMSDGTLWTLFEKQRENISLEEINKICGENGEKVAFLR